MSIWDILPCEIQKVILEFREHVKIIEYFTVHVKVELLDVTSILRYCYERYTNDMLFNYERIYRKKPYNHQTIQCVSNIWMTDHVYVPNIARDVSHKCRLNDGTGYISWKSVYSF